MYPLLECVWGRLHGDFGHTVPFKYVGNDISEQQNQPSIEYIILIAHVNSRKMCFKPKAPCSYK